MARAVRAEYAEILCRATRAGMPQSVWTDNRLVDCIYRRQFARQKAVERNGHLMVVCYCRCPGRVVRVAGAAPHSSVRRGGTWAEAESILCWLSSTLCRARWHGAGGE